MAVLQIHVIRATGGRNQLNDRIKYIMNPEKTACKGFHSFFGIKDTLTSGFTCACDEAYQQMMETKQHEKKTDKVLGYHYIQSFKPGEVTPEEAHQVGCEFIERCFAEDFEVVIGTHTDHAHIHNHIILNSVSFVDGHKFQSTPASFYKLRAISDEICRAHHLSVIDDPKTRKAKHYAEWKAEQEYRPTIRNEIRRDIDVVLKQSHSLNIFWELLRLRGYEIKFNEKRKYAAIRPPNGKRFIRMKSLGEEYTPRELVKRLEAADKSEVAANRRAFQQIYQQRKHRKKYYALPWTIIPHRRLTLRGIRALYWRYVYMLSKVRARKAPRAVRGVMLDELKKLERYSQPSFLSTKGLNQLMHSVAKVKRQINPRLNIDGILLTMVDNRTNNAKAISTALRAAVSDRVRVFDTQIPFSVRAAESAQEGQSIFAYDKGGKVAAAYEAVTKEVLEHESKERHRSRSDGVR